MTGRIWLTIAATIAASGCCFGPAPAPAPAAPPRQVTPAEAAAGVQIAIAREAEAARAAPLTPDQHLAMADGFLAMDEPNAVQVAQARAHIESVEEDHDPARRRALRRLLDRHERRVGAAMLTEARARLRAGETTEARLALAAVPPQSAAARQVPSVTRQIEQREQREARALAARGPLTDYEAERTVLRHLLASAHDPGSIELQGCGGLWWNDDSWMIDCAFRGTNGFGATVLNARRFYIRQQSVVRSTPVSRIRE